jgi:hypothetical protein
MVWIKMVGGPSLQGPYKFWGVDEKRAPRFHDFGMRDSCRKYFYQYPPPTATILNFYFPLARRARSFLRIASSWSWFQVIRKNKKARNPIYMVYAIDVTYYFFSIVDVYSQYIAM